MAVPTKDEIIKDLIEFFLEELGDAPALVGDWLAQGQHDMDEFIAGVRKLKTELALRD